LQTDIRVGTLPQGSPPMFAGASDRTRRTAVATESVSQGGRRAAVRTHIRVGHRDSNRRPTQVVGELGLALGAIAVSRHCTLAAVPAGPAALHELPEPRLARSGSCVPLPARLGRRLLMAGFYGSRPGARERIGLRLR